MSLLCEWNEYFGTDFVESTHAPSHTHTCNHTAPSPSGELEISKEREREREGTEIRGQRFRLMSVSHLQVEKELLFFFLFPFSAKMCKCTNECKSVSYSTSREVKERLNGLVLVGQRR